MKAPVGWPEPPASNTWGILSQVMLELYPHDAGVRNALGIFFQNITEVLHARRPWDHEAERSLTDVRTAVEMAAKYRVHGTVQEVWGEKEAKEMREGITGEFEEMFEPV